MNFTELKKSLNAYKAVFYLEQAIPYHARLIMKRVLLFFVIISCGLSLGFVPTLTLQASIVFFISLFFFLIMFMCDAYYYSFYFGIDKNQGSFELAEIIFQTDDRDATKSFINSKIGNTILTRCGIAPSVLQDFLKQRKLFVQTNQLSGIDGGDLFLGYIKSLLTSDHEFRNLLLAHGLTDDLVLRTSSWVIDMTGRFKRQEQWWSEMNLQRIAPIGRDWAYGVAYELVRWSRPLRFDPTLASELHSDEEGNVETLLSRSKDANVLIVGEEGSGKMEILEALSRKIYLHTAPPALSDKKILVLDTVSLSAYAQEKTTFEQTIISILKGAHDAGNLILVFPDLPSFIKNAEAFQSDVVGLLNPYISSPNFNVVAICDLPGYHQSIERNDALKARFEIVMVRDGDDRQVTKILEEEILIIEQQEGVFIVYPALLEAVQSSKKYIVETSLFEASKDLLYDAVAFIKSQNRYVVEPQDILHVIKTKTGIPTGEIDEAEKNKLQNLETHLHERIIGQDEAITAIANALRRARSGIANPARPVGSFLFLGPTGVGKTETTKALAEIFFGEKSQILRLDMSEYNTPDALNRLIGAYDGDTPGVLASMVRENPYGVLLLDEFEKTDRKVLDLFLQILDEGFFTDVLGRKVNLRNLIIVATSNAGSDTIFDIVESGQSLESKKSEIIDTIVEQAILKPELINRFDGVIVFHPLTDVQLKEVARVMLGKLTWRLKEKGMNLIINEPLLTFLVMKGSDPKFGARPIARAIQDTVEKKIADKIISGNLKSGSNVEFGPIDLQ